MEATSHPVRNNEKVRTILADPTSFASTLTILVADLYTFDVFEWTPSTVRVEIRDDFGIEMPSANFDRLMTGFNLITSNGFYVSLPDFNDFCRVLSGESSGHEGWAPADCLDVAWGITEAVLLSPPEDMEKPFSEEIVGFISEVVKSEGIITPPDILGIGGIDHELVGRINNDFGDDPDMFGGIWDMEKSKTDDINNAVKYRLKELAHQIEALPLSNGSADQIIDKMRRNLAEII